VTIWEQLEECVGLLDEPFRRSEIIGWFRRHHPDVNEASLAAHIQGAVANVQNRGPFASRTPLLDRIDHGLYRRHQPSSGPGPERTPRAVGTAPAAVLVGCVKTKLATAARARDLYSGSLFNRRRDWAERSGLPWFVVSARWGLVRPDEVIAPYDLHLADTSTAYRRAWGEFVAAQLVESGIPAGASVELHAGQAYAMALRSAFASRRIDILDPVGATSMGDMLAWYDRQPRHEVPPKSDGLLASHDGQNDVLPGVDLVAEAVARLGASEQTETIPHLRQLGLGHLSYPGLYSWWVDAQGARDLSEGIGIPVDTGLIYAGQAGATRWPSGRASCNTLWLRIIGMHVDGNAEFSTFRRTLNVALRASLGLSRVDHPTLGQWIEQHLRVAWWAATDRDSLGEIEKEVLRQLDPPLNLAGMPGTPLRIRITQLRRGLHE